MFVDDACAESLHWAGGLGRLERAGAAAVKEFNSFEQGSEADKKAVFLIGGPVVDLKSDVLGEIVRNSKFEYVTVVSTASAAVHNGARFPGREVADRHTMDELEQQGRRKADQATAGGYISQGRAFQPGH